MPQVIKAQLPKFAESRLQRHASVGALTFNPFTLRLAALNPIAASGALVLRNVVLPGLSSYLAPYTTWP